MRRRLKARVLRCSFLVGVIGLAVLVGVGLSAAAQSAEAGRTATRSDELTCKKAGARFAGWTSQGTPICFTFTRDKARLIEWAATVRPGCPGMSESVSQDTLSIPVSAGRFLVTINDPPHLRLNLQGQIAGAAASGTISVFLDEEGCGVANTHWTAHQGAATTPPATKPPALKPKPPVIARHPNVQAEATRPLGAKVSYRPAKVTGATSVRYSKASGTWFALGTTPVTVVAKNKAGTARSVFKVKVVDTTAPVFGPLPDITVTATSASGANVTYNVTVTHPVGRVLTSCSPVSGSLFPVGTTAVQCTSRDAAGNNATASFNVIVNPALPPGLVPNGHYTGTTSQGEAVSFTAMADGLHLTSLSITGDMTCSPNGTVSFTTTASSVTVALSGIFDLTGTGPITQTGYAGSWSASMHGVFAATGLVSGTYQAHVSLSVPGAYECDTGAVTWTASRTS